MVFGPGPGAAVVVDDFDVVGPLFYASVDEGLGLAGSSQSRRWWTSHLSGMPAGNGCDATSGAQICKIRAVFGLEFLDIFEPLAEAAHVKLSCNAHDKGLTSG